MRRAEGASAKCTGRRRAVKKVQRALAIPASAPKPRLDEQVNEASPLLWITTHRADKTSGSYRARSQQLWLDRAKRRKEVPCLPRPPVDRLTAQQRRFIKWTLVVECVLYTAGVDAVVVYFVMKGKNYFPLR
jgi:hypothetical protein